MTKAERAILTIIVLSSIAMGYLLGVIVTGWAFARYAPDIRRSPATTVNLNQI